MKVALVHELLTMKGGAEHVLGVLADMFPEAPIYTLLYDEKLFGDRFPKARVHTSHLQPWTLLSKNHHWYLGAFPRAVEAWDFSAFDLVISTSSAFAHGIITNGKPKHLCYVHSPARYLWDRTHDVQRRAATGPLGWARGPMIERLFHRLRVWDSEAADRPDMLLAASKEVQRRIKLYWRRESSVVYPPLDDLWLTPPESKATGDTRPFLIVSTLAPYKRIDLAVTACSRLGLPLIVAGQGPDRRRLERLAGPTVTFAGYRNIDQLRRLYADARAVLFPGDEDFGLVPLEAMASGTPVIAFRSGGAQETMEEGATGLFFEEATPESLMSVLQTFDPKRFDAKTLEQRVRRFTRTSFEEGIRSAVSELMR